MPLGRGKRADQMPLSAVKILSFWAAYIFYIQMKVFHDNYVWEKPLFLSIVALTVRSVDLTSHLCPPQS